MKKFLPILIISAGLISGAAAQTVVDGVTYDSSSYVGTDSNTTTNSTVTSTNTNTNNTTIDSTNTNTNTNTSTIDSTSTNTNINTNTNLNTNNTTVDSTSTNTNINTNNNIISGGTNNTNTNTNVNTSTIDQTTNNTNNSTINSTTDSTINQTTNSTIDQNINQNVTSNVTSNNTNTNTNTNTNNTTVDSTSNNTNNNNNNNNNTSDITQRVISPPPTAIAPTVQMGGNDTCTVTYSAAVQTQILGASGGGHVRDLNCERLKNSKTLYNMGMKVAAVSLMCQDPSVYRAMEMAGTPCPFDGSIGVEAKAQWDANPEMQPTNIEQETRRNDKVEGAVQGILAAGLLTLLLGI